MSNDKKFTRGQNFEKCFDEDENGWSIMSDENVDVCLVSRQHYHGPECAEANADLICEAFNVATETGMTPSDLQKRIKELEDALAKYECKPDCLHPISKRTYIGEGYLKCGVCQKEFK